MTRTVALWSTWSVNWAIVERLKPCASTEMEYSPAGRNVARNSPCSFVCPVRARPVFRLVTVTAAPGTTARVLSSAMTLMVP
jgi:hypothetical protein